MTARTAKAKYALSGGHRIFFLVMIPALLVFGIADIAAGHPWVGALCLLMFVVDTARLIASQVSQ